VLLSVVDVCTQLEQLGFCLVFWGRCVTGVGGGDIGTRTNADDADSGLEFVGCC